MNCNIFNSLYHSYRVTPEGKVYSKYSNQELSKKVKNKYNEVLFSMGTGKQRLTQWIRVDHLVASKYILNPNDYLYLSHKDGNLLNDNVNNLEWKQFCTGEEAKEIEGYYGKYIITSSGKVYNNFTGEPMKSRIIQGYYHVGLRVFDGETSVQKLFKVHRLVAEYFLPKIEGKTIVNHKDGNKLNNDVSNLEWCNYSENNIHAVKMHLIKRFWDKEKALIAITLIERYDYSCNDVALLLGTSKNAVKYLYKEGYKTWDVLKNPNFKMKTSKYIEKKEIPASYKQYILEVLKDNTVLNSESKKSEQCNE